MRGKTAEDLKLLELLDPVAEAAGYEIIRLRLMGGNERRRLQIMAERASDGDMVVEAETDMFPLAWIVEAKLVLTDELMTRGAEGRAARLASEQQQTTE